MIGTWGSRLQATNASTAKRSNRRVARVRKYISNSSVVGRRPEGPSKRGGGGGGSERRVAAGRPFYKDVASQRAQDSDTFCPDSARSQVRHGDSRAGRNHRRRV